MFYATGRRAEAARSPGVDQPKVSALKHDKLDGLSVECLMVLLGRDVEIVVRKKPAPAPRPARRSWRREGPLEVLHNLVRVPL